MCISKMYTWANSRRQPLLPAVTQYTKEKTDGDEKHPPEYNQQDRRVLQDEVSWDVESKEP